MANQELKLCVQEKLQTEDFLGAKKVLKQVTTDEKLDILMAIAMDSSNDISPYFFVLELIFEEETAALHDIAATLLSNPFCWIKGAYQVALRHEQQAIKLDPNNSLYKKKILNFALIPERPLSIIVAADYAQEVLEKFPQHRKAQEVMRKFEKISKHD